MVGTPKNMVALQPIPESAVPADAIWQDKQRVALAPEGAAE